MTRTRFEIQDLVSQNQDGVTFRALDRSTNQIVSLRRFFPFGQCDEEEEGGEGLDKEEAKAFSSACERLSDINHPALRRTIFGDTDPVDGMPYLVTEWIEGESLSDVLGNNTMDPSMIIGLTQQALDVCTTLSNILKDEAVWIDTKLEAIIVSNPTENPTFGFRICPFKWLGTQSHQKDLTGIVSMVEALIGWKSKLVSDQAGLGLGGWLKLLRQNPQMSLQDALHSLPDPVVTISSEQVAANSLNQPVQQAFILASANQNLFSKKNIIIMAISACFTATLIFFFFQSKQKQLASAVVPTENQVRIEETDTVKTTIEPDEEIKSTLVNSVNQEIEAKALKMKEELLRAEALKAEKQAALKAGPMIFTPDDVEGIAKIKLNQAGSIKGVVKLVKIPTPGAGIYISFSDPWDEKQNRVVIYPKSFEGGRYINEEFLKIEQELQKLVGKTVTFTGVVTRHIGKTEPHYVRIDHYNQIAIEGETNKTVIAPTELEEIIKKSAKNSPVKYKGVLREVKYNNTKGRIILLFSKPYINGQVRGVVYQSSFMDTFDLKTFDEYIDKEIELDGIIKFDQGRNAPFVAIDDLDQISTDIK